MSVDHVILVWYLSLQEICEEDLCTTSTSWGNYKNSIIVTVLM